MEDNTFENNSNWTNTTLRKVISSGLISSCNNRRIPLSSTQRSKMQGKYPYYGAASAIDYINDFKYDGYYLLVAEDGTVFDGKSPMLQLVNGKFWVSNHSHVLQGKSPSLTKFLFYVLKNVNVAPYITGAVQPKLTKENLYNFSFSIPSNELEILSVTEILSSLDDKIELLREQNKTLEELAQLLFNEWFVKFNFPNFNGKKANSELGEIPESWKVGCLSDEMKITMGQSPNGETYNQNGEGLIFFQGRAEFQERFPTTRLYTTEPKRLAEKFDVLVSVRAPVGDINVAFDKCCIGRGLAAINCKYKSFSLYRIKSLQGEFKRFESEGTVFGSINKDSFNNIKVVIPDNKLIERFDSFASSLDQKYFINYLQIKTLSKLRDMLLPKLMKGEIRVKGI